MDELEDLTEAYKQTTVHIIETLQPLIDDDQYLHSITFSMPLEKILAMLTKNLTYDDPGIFENIIIDHPACRAMHESFNMWLNNQIIFIFSTTTNKSIRNHIYDAQLKMLSAGYLKQRWLFDKLLMKYVQLCRSLADYPTSRDELKNTQIFKDAYDLTAIKADCKWNEISLVNAEARNSLLENNIKLLTAMLKIMNKSDRQLECACTESVLHAFQNGILPVKTMCIRYFKKLCYRITIRTELSLLPVLRIALEQSIIIDSHLDWWLRNAIVQECDVNNFYQAAASLFGIRELVQYFTLSVDRQIMLRVGLSLITEEGQSVESEFRKTFVESVLRFTVNILKSSDSGEYIEDVMAIFNRKCDLTPSVLQLFEYCMLYALKQCDADHKIFEFASRLADTIFLDLMNCDDEKSFIDKLLIIKALTKELVYADHEFVHWHQNIHLNGVKSDSCCCCCSSTMEPLTRNIAMFEFNVNYRTTHSKLSLLFQSIVEKFIAILESTCIRSYDSVHEITEIALTLLGSGHCTNANLQLKLLQVGMSTFVYSSEMATSFQSIQRPYNTGTLETFHISLIQCFLGADLTGLADTVKSNLISLLGAIEPRLLRTNILYSMYLHCTMENICSIELQYDKLMQLDLSKMDTKIFASEMLKTILCLASNACYILRKRTIVGLEYQVVCTVCDKDSTENAGVIMLKPNDNNMSSLSDIIHKYSTLFHSDNEDVRMNMIKCLPSIANHYSSELAVLAERNVWPKLFNDSSIDVRGRFANILHELLASAQTPESQKAIVGKCMENLRTAVISAFSGADVEQQPVQASVVMMILHFSTHNGITEDVLLRCFKMQLIFIIRVESAVAKNAMLAVTEMCTRFGTSPAQLFDWYKDIVLGLLIDGAVTNFMEHGLGIIKTLANFYEMMDQSDYQRTFIPKNMCIIISMLLPWRIKLPRIQTLLNEVCMILNTNLKETLSASAAHAYLYLFLNEPYDVYQKCIAFIVEHTEMSIEEHLQADSRKTLYEVLVWYHRSPEYVMQTLRMIIGGNGTGNSTDTTLSVATIAEYISTRFLGVLTYFSMFILTDLEREKQQEMLLSLGELIRFMDSKPITPFRFKILTVLRTALDIHREKMREICAQVWKIFIYAVDVQSMGPLLSTIVVSLEPLMLTHADIVDELLQYLIISNCSLLSIYISDLFFIEDTGCSDVIKEFVTRHLLTIRGTESFEACFHHLSKQINHENMEIRVHALRYLTKLFNRNRRPLNSLIIGQQQIDPVFADLLNTLVHTIKHSADEQEELQLQLHIAAGVCLGAVGAIEPSLLSPNYAPQKKFALSIHTDAFSIMALSELCRSYQSQKDTQRVDGFSLAIQEILLASGVCPEKKTKMDVWNAIPERMRQLMEPLLKSCYMISGQPLNVHPIFGSTLCVTSEKWAYHWAYRMIDSVEVEETKHLLKSFKSCIRLDNSILAIFLPYILVHTLQSCSAQSTAQIVEELQCVFAAVTNRSTTRMTEIDIKCAKMAFNLLDFLDCWMRQCEGAAVNKSDVNYKRIEAFHFKFDKKYLANANFQCGEYARALMYIEMYIEEQPKQHLQPHLSFMAQIFAELMDPDSLEGALGAKHSNRTLNEQVLLNNSTGRLQDSTVCFEKMMQIGDVSEQNVIDMIQCYIGLDQPETALLVSESLMQQMYEQQTMHSTLLTGRAECLWRLSRFEELDDLLENQSDLRNSSNWGIRCGQTLLGFRQGKVDLFTSEVRRCRLSVLEQLRAASGDEQISYNKLYALVMKLSLVSEMELAQTVVQQLVATPKSKSEAQDILMGLFIEWDARLELLQPTARTLVPVLCLRRILLNETKEIIRKRSSLFNEDIGGCVEIQINDYIGKSLIKSIELARNAEMYQQAQLFTFNAETYAPRSLFIEKAKLMWKKGDQAASLKMLERGADLLQRSLDDNKNIHDRQIIAEAKYLIATYNAESMNTNTQFNVKLFQSALQALPESEKCLVHYAQYLERLFAALTPTEQLEARGNDYQQDMMTCYGKSLMYGCNYVHQSMPRLLSIWLDFTARRQTNDSYRKVFENLNKITERFCDNLPAFMFYTAFSQLVSRICHLSSEVFAVLKKIIIKLILQFPQQSLWTIMNVSKSSYNNRVKRCTEIFSDKRLNDASVQKLINDFNLLTDRMIELTNTPVSVNETSLIKVCRSFPKLLQSSDFSSILLPIRKHMLPVLPPISQRDQPAHTFNAFPNSMVSIAGVRNEMIVLLSLQKPKRITLIGSDGCNYMMMLKPKDDLRKDYRLMEFNAIVNQHLRQDTESRQRRLYIRTYAVMPLNEECGIMEWVSNLQAFRPICMAFYKRKKINTLTSKEIKDLGAAKMTPAQRRESLEKHLIPRHPDVFAEWFRERFTTPHNWYLARSSYVRTTAVMSIVGYILGLGDRHGENILFDDSNGDTVHVDLNCLFNRGEGFEVPEVVPFRLTHNMVHAMGPLGVEGLYRKCSEITLKVLQEQMATLLSVLRPFLYDPMVTWSRTPISDNRTERTDNEATRNVKRIEERLRGYVKMNDGTISKMALSTEGVVSHCISQATDLDKLSVMYIGWGPYL